MPSPRDELTIGEWAVLALPSEAATHGFAIARTMAPAGSRAAEGALRPRDERSA